MSTFVLIHGAWHGAWCWARVVPELEALGHRAVAPDLPGHGDDRTPVLSVTLDDYVRRIVEVLDAQESRVVLVGHSMGGMAISAAAECRPDRIDWLVYLAAFLPRDGESLLALEERNPRPSVPPNVVPNEDKQVLTLKAGMPAPLFYQDCTRADADWATARLCPQSAKPLHAEVRLTPARFGRVPRAYIECLHDCAIGLEFQRDMTRASPCAKVIALASGHSPFLSAPAQLARALHGLATDATDAARRD